MVSHRATSKEETDWLQFDLQSKVQGKHKSYQAQRDLLRMKGLTTRRHLLLFQKWE